MVLATVCNVTASSPGQPASGKVLPHSASSYPQTGAAVVSDLQMPPQRLGPYRVEALLGRGGMGVVYRGVHDVSSQTVAIKTVNAIAPKLLAALRAEVQALKRVRHPGVVRIVNEGLSDEIPWYAMECLEGQTLAGFNDDIWRGTHVKVVKESTATLALTDRESTRLPLAAPVESTPPSRRLAAGGALEATLSLYRGICAALDHIHRTGLIHRDLKPSNVFLNRWTTPVLMDFGLVSKSSGGLGREGLATSWHGRKIGTLPYLSPEQLRGELVDARADLYALGCMLYETLVGRPPFVCSTVTGFIRAHLEEPPVPPSQHVSELPKALDALVLRLLAKSPHDRIGRADDVIALLTTNDEPHRISSEFGENSNQPYLYRPRLTGRADLLAAIDERRRAARAGRGSLLLIGGESGIGKTFLVSEAAQRAASDDARVLTGECQPPTGDKDGEPGRIPFGPLRSLLEYVADRCRQGDETTTERLLGARCRLLFKYEPSLAYVPGQGSYEDPPKMDPRVARSRTLQAMADTIKALSSETPLVVILDDLQWADELTLDLLALLASDPLDTALVILGTYRNDETSLALQRFLDSSKPDIALLSALDKPKIARLVGDMLAIDVPPQPLVDLVIHASEGNPFFAAEYLRLAVAEGLIRRMSGDWVVSDALSSNSRVSLPLPRSIHDLGSRRLAALDPRARRVVETAAVLGREFDVDLLGALLGGQEFVFDGMESLRRLQILTRTGENTFRFVHDRLREAVYSTLPGAVRRALHEEAARMLELRQTWLPDAVESFPLIAYHWANAGQHLSAARYLIRSAKRARAVHANEDAKRFYVSAVENLAHARAQSQPTAPHLVAEITALEELGDLLMLSGAPADAKERYESALDLVAGEPHVHARFLRKLGRTFAAHHRHHDALAAFERAESALSSAPQDSDATRTWRERVEIRNDRIWSYYWTGAREALVTLVAEQRPIVDRFGSPLQRANFYRASCLAEMRQFRYRITPTMIALARAAYSAAASSEDVAEVASTQFNLGFVLMLANLQDEAEPHMAEVLAAAERLGDRGLQIRALAYYSVIERLRGRPDSCEERAAKTRELATNGGMPHYLGIAYANLGWVELGRGGLGSARELLDTAVRIWRTEPPVYPFQWLALWPLLGLAEREGRWSETKQLTGWLLAEDQQRLSQPVERYLVLLLDRHHEKNLSSAIAAAHDAGYL